MVAEGGAEGVLEFSFGGVTGETPGPAASTASHLQTN